jgi:drug/metabolite transporter (DMT)-like permease
MIRSKINFPETDPHALVRSATNTIVPARLARITHPELLPVATVLTAVACWGGSFVAMRVAVGVLAPYAVMWIRMLVALAVLLPWMPRRLNNIYHRGDWPLLAAMVIF